MKKLWTALCVAPLLLASAAALAQAHSDKQTKEDIERHRAMAAAQGNGVAKIGFVTEAK